MVSFSLGTSSGGKTPLEKEIIEATSKDLFEDPWDKIMTITDTINNDAGNQSEICKVVSNCISKRIQDNTNANILNRTLTLLLSIGENCGSRMKQEISSRDFTDCLKKYVIDNKNVHYSIKKRMVEVLYQLSESFKNDSSLKLLEDLLNYMVYKYPEFIPDSLKIQLQSAGPSKSSSSNSNNLSKLDNPLVPHKQDLSTKELQNEEKELQLALKLSLEEYKSSQKLRDEIIAASNGSHPNSNQSTVIGGTDQATVVHGSSTTATKTQFQSQSQFEDVAASSSHVPTTSKGAIVQKSYQDIIKEHQAVNPDISIAELDQFVRQTPTNNLKVRALFTHKSSEPDELSFEKNDIITVTESVYKDWWRGTLKGEVGIFPLNYVKPYNEEDEKMEILKDLEMENQIIQQSKNIDRLLLRLQASNASDNLQQISDTINDDMVQDLYTQLVSLRPYVAKLIKKYSSKKDELISLNSKLNDAQGKYNVLMNNYISGYDQSQVPVMPSLQQPILQQQSSNPQVSLVTPTTSQYTSTPQSQMPSLQQQPSNSRISLVAPIASQYISPSLNQQSTVNPFKHQPQEEIPTPSSVTSDLQNVHISPQDSSPEKLGKTEDQKHGLSSSVAPASQYENISHVSEINPIPTTQFSQHSIPVSVLEQLKNSKNSLPQQQAVVNSFATSYPATTSMSKNPPYPVFNQGILPDFTGSIPSDHFQQQQLPQAPLQQLPQAPLQQPQQQQQQQQPQTTDLARHRSSVLSGASPFPSNTSSLLPKSQPSLE